MTNTRKIQIVFLVLAVLGLIGSVYFYRQYQIVVAKVDSKQSVKEDPEAVRKAAIEENKKLIAAVEKLIDLPAGEEPMIATVTDVEKLKAQAFFVKAKNGYRVLIYTTAKKAILYDSVTNKVVEVAPINIGTPSAQLKPQVQQPKVGIRNGTETAGLTTRVETELKKTIPELNVTVKDNSKSNYSKTIVAVIANNEVSKTTGESVAKALGASVGALPEGEVVPAGVDILVLAGSDQVPAE